MPTQLQLRRGTTTEHSTFSGAVGEVTVDTTKDTLIVHDGATNGGFPLAKEAGATFGNTNVTGNFSFADNAKAIFGAGSDLEIFHDGLNSRIAEAGTGDLKIGTSGGAVRITANGVADDMIVANQGGSVTLSHAGTTKLSTTATGVDVTGGLNTTGNVGIGTTSPDYNLVVKGSTNTNANILAVKDSDNTKMMSVEQTSNGDGRLFVYDTAGNADILLHTNGNSYFDGGNVGIGTTTPDAEPRLHVRKGDAGGVDSAANSVLTLENNTTAVLQFLTPNNASQQIRFGDPQDTGAGFIQYNHSANAIQFGTNGPEKMRLDSNGNLGIGTSNPGMLLDVDASGSGANDIARFSGRNSAGLTFRNATSQDFIIHTATSDALIFGTNGNNERMRISSSGNVGIGTNNPVRQLMVQSAINSNGYTEMLRLEGQTLSNGWERGIGFFGNDGGLEVSRISSYLTGAERHLRFTSAGVLGMTIRENGKVCVGTSSPVSLAMLTIQPNDTNRIINTRSFNTSLQYHHVFESNSGAFVGGIAVSTTSTTYNTSSDYRLKENVTADWDATTRLKQLNPVRFNFIADADTTVDGFLAHEVQDVVPEAISGTKDGMRDEEYEVTPAVLDDDGNEVTPAVMGTRSVPDWQGIDQSKLVPLLVKTIQELEARITALEAN